MITGLKRGAVMLEPHSKEWKADAENTINELKKILQSTAIDIQHIGSTSINDIYAKPIIDIVIGVSRLDNILKMNDLLQENGFIFRGQDQPKQYLYVCGENNIRTHHIHAVIYNSEE